MPQLNSNAIHIDFETYSEADLRKVGAWAYSCHPSTEVICMAYSQGEKVSLTTGYDATWDVLAELNVTTEVNAWNSFFEYCIIQNVLGLGFIDISRFRDTAASAAALSLPWALGKCGDALGVDPDEAKDKRGKYLIQKLCKPQRKGERCRDPELLEEFYEYCRQDVISEMAIHAKLPKLNATEQKVWMLDQVINARGVPVDVPTMESAQRTYQKEYDAQFDYLKRLTGLDNPNSRKQFLEWVQQYVNVENTQAATLRELAESQDALLKEEAHAVGQHIAPNVLRNAELLKEAIGIKLTLASAAPKKYTAMLSRQVNGRIHGVLKYHGASTGRWASTGVNFQNLARPTIKDIDYCISQIPTEDNEWLSALYDDTMGALSSCIRGMVKAPEGQRFIVADYSAIEARVLAWLAGQEDVLDVFRSGQDVYKHAASGIYNVKYEQVDSEQRFVGKTAILALGYQGGAVAFQAMAKNYNVEIPEEKADSIKKAWRASNKKIVSYWYALEAAAVDAVVEKGSVHRVKNVSFKHHGRFLYCTLPSGRRLAYYNPRLREGSFKKMQVVYETNTTRGFMRQHTYGGKLAENITQAVARDIMAEAMLRVEEHGYEVILSVHDELIALSDNDYGSVSEFEKLMCRLPEWANGLPVDAEGYESERYRK